MTILPTLALRSFVGFDNLFNELETMSTQKQNSFPAHDIIRISEDEYEITIAVAGFGGPAVVGGAALTLKGILELMLKIKIFNIYIKVLLKDLLSRNFV